MRLSLLVCLVFAAGLEGLGQTAASKPQPLPKDPRAILAEAAPYYDFSDPSLKPWHMKATYQLYDDKGKPSEQGTFEYWWASPKVHRSTWTRPGASRTDWYTADGKHAYRASGSELTYFEYMLESTLVSPLPSDIDKLDLTKVKLSEQGLTSGSVSLNCIQFTKPEVKPVRASELLIGENTFACFGSDAPVLRLYDFSEIVVQFNDIVEFQHRFLSRNIEMFNGSKIFLTSTVSQVTVESNSGSAVTPDADATIADHEMIIGANSSFENLFAHTLKKKRPPVYPRTAKEAQVSGDVLLQAMIGVDGKVRDVKMVSSPSPMLTQSAIDAVSHWVYEPYVRQGKPVEVMTLIHVYFLLG